LEGDGGGSSSAGAPPLPTAATNFATSSRHDPHSSETLQSLRVPHHSNPNLTTTTTTAAAAAASANEEDQAWSEMPPLTPAVQFYSHTPQTSNVQHRNYTNTSSTVYSSIYRGNQQQPQHRQQQQQHQYSKQSNPQYPDRPKSSGTPPQYPQHPPIQQHPSITSTSQSSSASSLSSMAAALIAGSGPGGILYNTSNNMHYQPSSSSQQQHQQQQQQFHHNIQRVASQTSTGSTPPTESPISPAAMIGLGYENLLLPPPGGPIAATSMPLPNVASNHAFPNNTNPFFSQQLQQQQTNPILPATVASLHNNPHSGLTPQQQQQHQQQFLYAAAAAHAAATAQRPVESEEKRAKRLERNRESARKSRRRKKERLATLGAQVQKLQNQIATERHRHIHAMVPALSACRTQELAALLLNNSSNSNDDEAAQQDLLARIIRGSGPSSQIMRSVLDFQYTTLKQMTLPSYQKLLLWFTLRDDSYFLAGKEQYAAQQELLTAGALGGGTAAAAGAGEATATGQKPATKVSSKQIGDEMLNGPGGSKAKMPGGSKGKNKRQDAAAESNNDDGSKNPTANAYDAARCWPLFCFEHKFSVEQEERFLATHRQIVAAEAEAAANQQQQPPPLAERRSQMAAAVHTTESLGKAVGSLGHVVAQREEKAYLGILHPQQVSRYQAWLETNRHRVRASAAGRGDSSMDGAATTAAARAVVNSDNNNTSNHEVTLQDICRRLNQVLQISSQSNSSSVDMNC